MSLRTTPISVRVFGTSVLLVLGLGFLLAMVYLFKGHVSHFVEEGHTAVEAIEYTYHGLPTAKPRLLVSLQGSMSATVSAGEYDAIEDWIEAGAAEETYGDRVGPIIEKNCASCHNKDGYYPTLEGYADIQPLTEPDTGMDVTKLARMTHVHLLGIPLLFYILGALFVRTRWREGLKAVIVVVPFFGVLMDIAHWWITKADKDAAVGVLIGGTLMGIGFALQWFMTIADIWLPFKGRSEPASTDTVVD